jgi:hypothetical protein
MVASATSVDPSAVEANASRYADMALTANYAATALRIMADEPTREISERYLRALRKMAETIDTMADLAQRDQLTALVDQSLDVVESLEPAQLVARLSTNEDEVSDASQAIPALLEFRDELTGLLSQRDADTARELLPFFKGLSRRAMISAQRAEEALDSEEVLMRSRLVRA